jgi:hypothetical protein
VGVAESSDCLKIMDVFSNVCNKLGVPIADEKTIGPCKKIEILGLTMNCLLKFQMTKFKNVFLCYFHSKKRVIQIELQSLTGMLAFCTRALPSARAFSRRLYGSLNKVHKSYYLIGNWRHEKRFTNLKGIFEQL